MGGKNSFLISSRRRFLSTVFPAGTMLCFACRNSEEVAQGSGPQGQSQRHKFAEGSGMSFQEVFDFAYRGDIRKFQNLATAIGHDKFLEMLKKASSEAAAQEARKNESKNDLDAFGADLRQPNHFWQHALTYQIVEDTPTAFEIKVTECIWAKTFRDADASDIGYATICHPDYAFAEAFNPKMKMIRSKTLMEGHERCNHRWILEV